MADLKKEQALIDLWEAKLKEEGLAPIGKENGALAPGKGLSTSAAKGYWATSDYFKLALERSHTGPFKSQRESLVWELHANGALLKDIVATHGSSTSATSMLLRKMRVRFGLPERMTQHPKRPSELDGKIAKLRSQGFKHREIASKLSISSRRVRNCLTRLGLINKRRKIDQ